MQKAYQTLEKSMHMMKILELKGAGVKNKFL